MSTKYTSVAALFGAVKAAGVRRTGFITVRAYSTSPSKVAGSPEEAIKDLKSDITLLCGGFGLSGVPDTLINALEDKHEVRNITAVSNNAGIDGSGLSKLLVSGQITKMISSYIGGNKTFESLYLGGKIDLELTPQGTIAERCRAGGAGVPAFYTATGVGTWVQEGNLPVRYAPDGAVARRSEPREVREFDGRKYLLEKAIVGDVAFVKAYKADTMGNCYFRGSARNFNSVMGRAGKVTIVEAENIVRPGEIAPEDVHLPGIYVSKVVQSTTPKLIEIYKNAEPKTEQVANKDVSAMSNREKIVRRAAQEFKLNGFANLGIGMPTLAPGYLPEDFHVTLQSENGILGLGPYPQKGEEDPDMINAGKETVTLIPGASLFGSEESFAMIRAGRVDLTILGAMQVSEFGDLANWALPGMVKGMGGAMDLVANPSKTRVVVVTEHVDKKGRSKIVKTCDFPLTGKGCVSRIITDIAVFDCNADEGLTLVEVFPGVTVEEVTEKTAASFKVADNLKVVEL
jgi:3-oxoacid CoA-transferase